MIRKIVRGLTHFFIGIMFGLLIVGVILLFNIYYPNAKWGIESRVLSILVFTISLILIYYLQIIIHEMGHLIFGLRSGYNFVSFRIGRFLWKKEDGKIQLKRFSVPGTAGQCLLLPPNGEPTATPYVLYHLGGCLLNLISILPALGLLLLIQNPLEAIYLLMMYIAMALFFAGINGIPLRINGIGNDGYNIKSIHRGGLLAKKAMWVQLKIHGELAQGKRMRELPLEWFELNEDTDLKNPIFFTVKAYKMNYYQDLYAYKEAQALALGLLKTEGLLGLFRNEVLCDYLFFELMNDCRRDVIDQTYSKELQTYTNLTRRLLPRQRLLYAYALLYKRDEKKAEKHLKAFHESLSHHPFPGEVLCEQEMMKQIKTLYEARTSARNEVEEVPLN